jgi:hypothetical protein
MDTPILKKTKQQRLVDRAERRKIFLAKQLTIANWRPKQSGYAGPLVLQLNT